MATFPKEEKGIFSLGQNMSAGLKANSDIFPAPPINTLDLDQSLANYVAKKEAVLAAQATLAQALDEKQVALDSLTDDIKSNVRYAEQAVNHDDAKLKTIGWGGRKEPTALTAPGRALDLTDAGQGEGWIKLKWKKPMEGGKAVAYKVLCRENVPGAEWKSEDTALSTEITLRGQPRGKELLYCVVAANKAGEGPESNPVMAVL